MRESPRGLQCFRHFIVRLLADVLQAVSGKMGVLHTQTDGGINAASELLIEAQESGSDALRGMIISRLFLQHLLALMLREVDAAQIVLADELLPDRVLAAGIEARAHLRDEVVTPIADDIGIVTVETSHAIFRLVRQFCTEPQRGGKVALCQWELKVQASLPFVLIDCLIAIRQLIHFPSLIVEVRDGERRIRMPLARILKRCCPVRPLEFQGGIAFVRTVFRGVGEAHGPVGSEASELMLAVKGEVHRLLAFKTSRLVVVAAGLRLDDYALVFR